MGLDGVDGNEKFVRDLLVGEAVGHEFEHFVFAFADAQLFDPRGVEREIGDWYCNDLLAGEAEPGPDADSGEDDGEESHVEFDGEVAHEVPVLQLFEQEDECCQREAVDDDSATHFFVVAKSMDVRKTLQVFGIPG